MTFDEAFEQCFQQKDQEEKQQWEVNEIKWIRHIMIPRMGAAMTTMVDVDRFERFLNHVINELRIQV